MDSVPQITPAIPTDPAIEPEMISEKPWPHHLRAWLLRDSPYIIMLSLALIGITFHMPPVYWLFLTPIFCAFGIVAGWRHFATTQAHFELIGTQVLTWGALILAIFVLYNNGAQGVLNANASALAIITLLALGTFLAGLQARVWRTCVVGGILFLAVPAIGWLQQSSILLVVILLALIATGGATWYFVESRVQAK